jgi:tRNA(Met) C34 N-acetyltransferase TmcA
VRPRRCVVVRGTRESTRRDAIETTRALDLREVVWCGADAPEGVRATSSRGLATFLWQSLSAVVLDLHDVIDPDALARAEGMIRGGGALVLRLGEAELPARADFAVHPFSQGDVGTRFAQRLAGDGPRSTETRSLLRFRRARRASRTRWSRRSGRCSTEMRRRSR